MNSSLSLKTSPKPPATHGDFPAWHWSQYVDPHASRLQREGLRWERRLCTLGLLAVCGAFVLLFFYSVHASQAFLLPVALAVAVLATRRAAAVAELEGERPGPPTLNAPGMERVALLCALVALAATAYFLGCTYEDTRGFPSTAHFVLTVTGLAALLCALPFLAGPLRSYVFHLLGGYAWDPWRRP